MSGYRITTPASGEALISAFFETVPSADGKGTETVRHRDPVWVSWGEIDAFAAKSGGNASTLDAHMRSLFTGERVGDESITRMKSGIGCILEAGSYRFVMYVGAQPDHAGVLLDDETGGTLQRLLWLPILDEDAPEDLDGAVEYRKELANLLGVPETRTETSSPNVAVWGPSDGFTVDTDILRVMMKRRSSILRGETEVNPLDTHIDNLRIRLALIFASWIAGVGNPAHVGKEAWWWACCLVEISRRTRGYCMDAAANKKKRTATDAGKTDAERFMAREAEIAKAERIRTDKLRDKIVDRLRDSGTLKHRDLQNAVTNSSTCDRRRRCGNLHGRTRADIPKRDEIGVTVKLVKASLREVQWAAVFVLVGFTVLFLATGKPDRTTFWIICAVLITSAVMPVVFFLWRRKKLLRESEQFLSECPDDVDTTLLLENVRSLRDDPKSWDVWETRESLKQLRGD
jgi:hypothetical protein